MKTYTYSLFLLLAALLLYSPKMDQNTKALFYTLLVFATFGALVEYLSAYALFRAWLDRFF